MRRSEIKLIRQAIEEKWPIPSEMMKELVDQLFHDAINSEDDRCRAHAAKALIAASGGNMKAGRLALDLLRFKLDKKAAELLAETKALLEEAKRGGFISASQSDAPGGSSGNQDDPPGSRSDNLPGPPD